MKPYGYDSYRGRSRSRTVLTVLAVILAVALVLAVAFFLFAQRYVVYTDDGRAHLELPFLQMTEPTFAPVPVQSQNIVIITDDPAPTPSATPAPEPEVRAVWLLRGALTDGTAQRQVESAGGNAVVFNMKADDGTLGYVSSLPQAIAFGTSDAKTGLNEDIKALTAGELYTIARVSCFKDNKAPRNDNSLAIRTNSGYNWQDPQGMRWLNVSVPEARQYVIGVCRELAELGFDEILLENSGYPTEGNLHYIKVGPNYDPEALSGAVETFYGELAEAMEEYPGVKLSFSVSPGVLNGQGDRSGQTLPLLGQYGYRVYAPAPEGEEDYAAGIAALAQEGLGENRVVYLTGMEVSEAAGNTLVKPWETPAPALTPPPSLPSAAPEPEASVSPEPAASASLEPSPEPEPIASLPPEAAASALPETAVFPGAEALVSAPPEPSIAP